MTEKTEQPTTKRRKEAAQEGQVIKSVEITSGMQLVAILLFFHFFTPKLLQRLKTDLLLPIQLIDKPFSYAVTLVAQSLLHDAALLLALFCGMIMVATVGAGFLQVGFILASKAVGLSGKRLNLVNNLKQIFSLRSLMELLKSSLKVILLSLIFAYLFYRYTPTFRALPFYGIDILLPVLSTLLLWMWTCLILFYLLLGVIDYRFQYSQVMKQLRMSKDEVKREYKDSEGDPHLKQRQREIQREIQSGSLARRVKQSSVIVRNPTHIAICLGYHPQDMPIPQVLEKGENHRAALIIALAEQESIPVVENIPLARKLFREVERGKTIPESLFEPVAALLRLVLKVEY